MNITILLFEEVDLLDFGGPYEVFLTASRLVERTGAEKPFNVNTVTLNNEPVTAYGGTGLVPSGTVDDLATTDILIVPGTIDIAKAASNKPLVNAIQRYANRPDKPTIASICTGSFLLAEAAVLDDCQWTTHAEDIADLANILGADSARPHLRWVDNGQVLTSGGLSTGIDLALHLCARHINMETAQRTAQQIEYRWLPDPAA